MRILLDTNILVRLREPQHPSHAIAHEASLHLRNQAHELCIVPQSIYEFWSVGTRPLEQNGLGLTLDEVSRSISEMQNLFRFLRDERAVYERWESLVHQHRVLGKQAHDARLVAAMLRHGLTHLLTFNVRDFKRYGQIVSIAPEDAEAFNGVER